MKSKLLVLLGLILTILLSYFNFLLIIEGWNTLGLSTNIKYITSFRQLSIIGPMIFEYILISLCIILFVILMKKGNYNWFKKYDEKFLTKSLFTGLICGLFASFLTGIIFWLIGSYIAKLAHVNSSSVHLLICGWFIGSIICLNYGLITGIIVSFPTKKILIKEKKEVN